MAPAWSTEQLGAVANARELEIATYRADGTLRRPTPIWAVTADDAVYVRTWVRRTTGWYGRAVESGRACVEVPGLKAEVAVEDVADRDPALRAAVDDAYREKYGHGESVTRMTNDDTAATTLRLTPSSGGSAPGSDA